MNIIDVDKEQAIEMLPVQCIVVMTAEEREYWRKQIDIANVATQINALMNLVVVKVNDQYKLLTGHMRFESIKEFAPNSMNNFLVVYTKE